MAFDPEKITESHIKEAAKKIEDENIKLIGSTGYDVLINGKSYPPKEIMRYAHYLMNGEKLWYLSGGNPTNRYLEKLGFEVKKKLGESDPLADLVRKYKAQVKKNQFKNEAYKWQLVNKFRGRPNIEAPDFYNEIKGVDFKNLVYAMGIAVLQNLAKSRPEELRACFKKLFYDDAPIQSRVNEFSEATLKIYRTLGKPLQHHQDERSIATYLTYFDADHYTFFKTSFYNKYCALINVKRMKPGEKYSHYLDLLQSFIEDYVAGDEELISLKKEYLPADSYPDANNLILAQDILYTMLDNSEEEIDIEDFSIYKISMGTFKEDEMSECIEARKVIVHSDTKGKGTSYESQGDLFGKKIRIGDYFYLTHGNGENRIKLIGRITSEAVPAIYNDLGDEGWLERSFDVLINSVNKKKYSGANKWWAPNNNSTCVQIKQAELDEANEELFAPYFNAEIVKSKKETEPEQLADEPDNNERDMKPLNIILYGPPGTGKTYNSIDRAVQLANPSTYTGEHRENKKVFDTLRKEGQIEFVTFHQNYTYEDFMTGLKPDINEPQLRFLQQKGIFYQLCRRARDNYEASKLSSKLQTFEELLHEWVLSKINPEQPLEMKTVRGKPFWLTDYTDNTIYLKKSTGSEIHTLSISTLVDVAEGRREMFSGLTVYYNPIIEFLKSNRKAVGSKEELKSFVLVIDEINRANISKVFGELITLLEPDKRLDGDNELRITLPNGEKDFAIPPNLHIIGTMNTADKSIALVDIALRRRFEFEGKYPDYSVIKNEAARELLKKINKAVFDKKKSADYLIGHAYFMNDLPIKQVLQNKVIPLLSEYFLGKADFIVEVFKETGWKVSYNTETYQWDITEP